MLHFFRKKGGYFTYIHQHQIQVSVLILSYLDMSFWFRYLCHNQGKGLILFRKISFLQKRWIQVKIFDQYFVFSEVELCRNTWKLENQDYYLYFSDRSYGGKRWLIDHVNWYQDPVKRNGNGNVGYVHICSTSVYLSLWRIWREVEISLWLWSRVEI